MNLLETEKEKPPHINRPEPKLPPRPYRIIVGSSVRQPCIACVLTRIFNMDKGKADAYAQNAHLDKNGLVVLVASKDIADTKIDEIGNFSNRQITFCRENLERFLIVRRELAP